MFVLLFWIALLLITITIHEYFHGLVAYLRGDNTAKELGRLSLNPLKHIDPLWTVLLPVFLYMIGLPPIGMAKPVPVNFLKLKNPKRDMIWVAAAGPGSNILFAAFVTIIYRLTNANILLLCVYFNLGLAMFNLIPIPPLDGSRVVTGLLPDHLAYRYGKLEPYGFFIIMILFWLGFLWKVVMVGMNFFCRILEIPTWVEFQYHLLQSLH